MQKNKSIIVMKIKMMAFQLQSDWGGNAQIDGTWFPVFGLALLDARFEKREYRPFHYLTEGSDECARKMAKLTKVYISLLAEAATTGTAVARLNCNRTKRPWAEDRRGLVRWRTRTHPHTRPQ